jgi:hypothetical protein
MVLWYMFLSLHDEVTNVLCVSLLSHDRYQYDSLILSTQTWAYPVNTCNSCCDVKGADVVLTSQKNAWKQIFIFPLRFYTNCVSTTLMVLKMLKVSISFIVTLYFLVKVLLAIELWDHVNCFCKTMKQILKNVWTVQKTLFHELSIVLHWPWTKCQHIVAWGWVVGRQVAHSGRACCLHLHAKTANTFSAWLMGR